MICPQLVTWEIQLNFYNLYISLYIRLHVCEFLSTLYPLFIPNWNLGLTVANSGRVELTVCNYSGTKIWQSVGLTNNSLMIESQAERETRMMVQ